MTEPSLTVGRPVVTGGDPARRPAAPESGSESKQQPHREIQGGRTVEAVVVGHDRAGAAILRTADGRVAMATAAALSVGTRLTFIVEADGSIRELTSRPAAPDTSGARDAGDLVRIGALSTGASRVLALPPGTLLRAEPLPLALQGGDPLPARGHRDGLFRSGEPVVLRLVAVTTADGSAIHEPGVPSTFVVKAFPGSTRLEFSSIFGRLQIAAEGHSDPAGRLTFRVIEPAPPGIMESTRSRSVGGELSILANAWPAMGAILGEVGLNTHAAMAASLHRDLPQPDEGFAGRVIRFVLGLAEGSPNTAPDHFFPALASQPEAKPLLDRLGDDLQRYLRWAEPGGEWRTFVVPVADGKALLPFHLYIRSNEKRRGEDAETGIRFLVDVDMTRLGAFQIDGLYRRRHLSLAVRSGRRLPRAFGEDLKEIFERSLLAAGMTGELRIEPEAEFNREPLRAIVGTKSGTSI